MHNVVWLIILWAVQYLQACARLMSSFSGYKDNRNELWAQTPPGWSKHGALIWWAIPNAVDTDDDDVTLVTSDWCLGRITGNWSPWVTQPTWTVSPERSYRATGTWPGCAGRRQSRDFRPEERHRAMSAPARGDIGLPRPGDGRGLARALMWDTGRGHASRVMKEIISLHNGRWGGH